MKNKGNRDEKILVLALSVWVLVNSGLYAETIEENIFLRKAHETQKKHYANCILVLMKKQKNTHQNCTANVSSSKIIGSI